MTRPPRKTVIWMIVLAGVLCAIVATGVYAVRDSSSSAGANEGKVADGLPGDWPAWGFSHTELSADTNQAAKAAIGRQPTLQGQHIMGFGANNPQPDPGRYDWTSLDRRVGLIKETKGVPVITLCCAPDWMKGGPAGQTDWAYLNDAPLPQHFDAFAAQAAEVAKRYPDVKYYFVWNEFKGFYNQSANRWDHEGYTSLYNKVYDALKKVNSDIKVGGPYMVVNSYADAHQSASTELRGPWGAIDQRAIDALRYWIQHKKGADFVVVDGSTLPEDRTTHTDEFMALGKFSALTRWLKEQTKLPVVWSEYYVEPENSGWTEERRTAVLAASMIEFAVGGASGALYWSPQRQTDPCTGCLWTASGQPLSALDLQQNFARTFKPGTDLIDAKAANPAVRTLASKDKLLAVNTSDQPVNTKADGTVLDLKPYEVRWMDR